MRIAILGDVHGNLEALRTVVQHVRSQNVDRWLQVGDVVGYGANPRECIDLLRELDCQVCMGNHDAAVVERLPTDYFNQYARAAIEWTRGQLRPEDLTYLDGLPLTVEHSDYTLVHGTLHMPHEFGYVFSKVEAAESLSKQRTPICFVGHSHVPAAYLLAPNASMQELQVVYETEFIVDIKPFEKTLANVGSVGQPRDEDPRAAVAIYDTDSGRLSIQRCKYDVATTQQKIRQAGLPDVLADRLSLGV